MKYGSLIWVCISSSELSVQYLEHVSILQYIFIRSNMAIGLGLHCKLRYISPLLRLYINVFYSIHLLAVIWHLITISIIIITIIIIIIIIFAVVVLSLILFIVHLKFL